MRTHATQASAIATCAKAKMDGLRGHTLFRIAVFTFSVAAGYGFSYLVYTGMHLLHSWSASAHDKASPVADILRTLHSGFSN